MKLSKFCLVFLFCLWIPFVFGQTEENLLCPPKNDPKNPINQLGQGVQDITQEQMAEVIRDRELFKILKTKFDNCPSTMGIEDEVFSQDDLAKLLDIVRRGSIPEAEEIYTKLKKEELSLLAKVEKYRDVDPEIFKRELLLRH
jgi:hypothetical protein